MTVRKLGPEEIEIAKALFILFQTNAGASIPHVPTDEYLKDRLAQGNFHVIVAVKDNFLVGGLTAFELPMYKSDAREMFLFEIDVAPAFRRQGIAKQLVTHLSTLCREKGIAEMFVLTSRTNIAAIKLYESVGGLPDLDSLMFSFNLKTQPCWPTI